MKAFYIIILAVSVGMTTAIFMRLYQQLAPVFDQDKTRVGALITLPALGFLIVAYTPAPVVFSGLLLTALGWWDERRGVNRDIGLAVTLLAVSIGLMGMPVLAWLPVPAAASMLAVWVLWWLFTFTTARMPHALMPCLMLVSAALAPLAVAPFIYPVMKNLALDIGILASAFFGAMFIAQGNYTATLALRLPLTFLVGYAILRALILGAWPFALASFAILALGFLRQPRQSGPQAGFHVQTF